MYCKPPFRECNFLHTEVITLKNTDLIKAMTLEEKAALTTGKNFWETFNVDRLGVKSLFLSDGPSGLRKQAAKADHIGMNPSVPATCFPSAATMANGWDLEAEYAVGKALGEEAASHSVNVLLGPGTCLKRNPLCGRNFEYFSEDPYLAGKMSAAFIKGIQSNPVGASLKHFACNNQEERRMVIDTIVDERTLRELYLTAFEIAVKEAEPYTLMSAYNKINGQYANENRHVLLDILRKEWGFKGVVVTDWGGDNDRVEGLKCGNDLEMPTSAGVSDLEIIDAIKSGKIDEALLDECVDRLLELGNKTRQDAPKPFDAEAHHKVAREAAAGSIVLLKNQDEILPLAQKSKLAFIGDFVKVPRYQGAGSSMVNPTKLDNTFDSLKEEYGFDTVTYAQGYERHGKQNRKLIEEACRIASSSDTVVLYLGLDEKSEVEGLDRKSLKIPQNQIDLLEEVAKVNKNVVVVLSCGCVVEMPWLDKVKGLLHGYLSGQAGASAVLDVLFGKVNPSGKLSETYPLHYEDIPSASHFPGKQVSVEYREGIFVGYRYFITANKDVLFPFGYGLSYTSFEYSGIKVDGDKVTFTVKNIGKRAGKEVCQLYVEKDGTSIIRARRELKGFAKVSLESGEEKTVIIDLDDKAFRYFNTVTDKWEVEEGIYKIEVGASSVDIRLTAEVRKSGTTTAIPFTAEMLPSYFNADVLDVSKEEFEKLLGTSVPDPEWNLKKPLGYNDTLSQLKYAKGGFARFGFHCMNGYYRFCKMTNNTNMVNNFEMSLFNMPFRGIVRMSGGAFDWPMLDGVMTLVNGHFWKGVHQILKANKAKGVRSKLRQEALGLNK